MSTDHFTEEFAVVVSHKSILRKHIVIHILNCKERREEVYGVSIIRVPTI